MRHVAPLAIEEELQLPFGALGGVGAVDEGVGEAQGKVAADGAGGCLRGVGRAHEPAHYPYGALALDPHRHDRGRGDKLDQLPEEGLLAVLSVMFFGELTTHVHHLHRADIEALGLDAAYDLTDQSPLNTVAFHQYERLLHLSILLPFNILFALHRSAVRAGLPVE